ncbi:hypothetical protein GGR21_003678 [Dysgonomonas hofstadii]|uniref:Uncharacterized protein n=1 Tax=Dysgonomonas hofstadii TaxID=637886 RepID=A0A840CNT2_9BACT|nr:hypothetical protein [Dysgonomonas hofstadii]MBB4037757.1 hypothetical protein [Dysgonomonas hofstadii]
MARPSCDPLQAQGLNQINSPTAQTVFGFTSLSPDGCPALRTNATGRTPDKAEYFLAASRLGHTFRRRGTQSGSGGVEQKAVRAYT